MILYEFITPSDPITFWAKDDEVAEAITLLVGNGKAGFKYADERVTDQELPNTILFISGFADGQEERFQRVMKDKLQHVIDAGKTFAVCGAGMREEYDTLTKDSADIEAVEKWDDRHRSSMSNWGKFARTLKLKETSCG